ncbi:unnamed protein product [Mytilus coruscus]|uniref:PKD/REJ-like domain-containing protein n=1 Tax=Mytilus coruscus TaxID=42192 RepID=A0A6J8CBI2_MYTCO|nr:unnamed protein product [Mytilus coruscus]
MASASAFRPKYGVGIYESHGPTPSSSPDFKVLYGVVVQVRVTWSNLVPPCFDYPMFSKKFLRLESPMVIYASSQVEIYLRTKNKCAPETIIHSYYELYKINNETSETQIGETRWNLMFVFHPGELDIGFYRLYAKIGYPNKEMEFWMEESMFIQIAHPPPHAFIKGGDGRTIGEGNLDFDARSVSYSIEKGPGNPTGLNFQWRCFNFMTDNLYNLLQFNIDPFTAFNDTDVYKKKWYETSYIPYIEDEVAFINGSTLYSVVKSLRNASTECLLGRHIYVKTEVDRYTTQTPKHEINTEVSSKSPENTISDINSTTLSYNNSSNIMTATLAPLYKLKPLTEFYEIDYMYEMAFNPRRKLSTESVIPVPKQSIIVKNEMLEFLESLYDEESEIFRQDTIDFFKYLSESSLTLNSLDQVSDLPGLPPSANATFFENLHHWIENAELSKSITNNLLNVISDFKPIQEHIMAAVELIDIIGIESFFQLKIDDSGKCLLDYLGDIFDGFITINSMRWHDMKEQEQYYLSWLGDEIFTASSCQLFNGSNDGHGNLTVTSQNVLDGMGFLLYIRVEYEQSVSYFIQHAQSIPGNVQELKIECRLNCMEKTALTSILSLRATCSSCTFQQQKENKFWWDVRNFDLDTKTSSNNSNWQSWMLSELNTSQFVIRANVLNESTGYLIESFMELATGEISTSIWIVKTNILPYGGSCQVEDADWGEKKVTTDGWKDEGYRSYRDSSYDWKEQINFRLVELTSEGKEILLYYGSEEDNYIRLKPGKEKDDYNVTIKVQIYDIFVDYVECTINVELHCDNGECRRHLVGNQNYIVTMENVDNIWLVFRITL